MIALVATALLASAPAAGPDGPTAPAPTLRWVGRSGRHVVEVAGLGPARLDALGRLRPDDPRWPDILAVRVVRPPGQPEAAPMVGKYEVLGDVLRFTPRYPLPSGMQFIARYHMPDGPESKINNRELESAHRVEPVAVGPATEVVACYPTADRLPENQLKLYLQFSAPMSRGEAYRRVRIFGAGDRPVERPFLEIGEELWDPSGTRLTLLFDPGRVKRGLVPREEEGPILEEGKAYTLVVDSAWPDAAGRPLGRGFRKRFRAGPPDEAQPLPARWTFDPPASGTRDPLVVRFPEPLDRAMLQRAIEVERAGAPIAGRAEVGPGETSWRFVPDRPWDAGPIGLRVDAELEDLAGNSIARPFEVDVVRHPLGEPSPPRVTVPAGTIR